MRRNAFGGVFLIALSGLFVGPASASIPQGTWEKILERPIEVDDAYYVIDINESNGTVRLLNPDNTVLATSGPRFSTSLATILTTFIGENEHGCEIASDATGQNLYIHGNDGTLYKSTNRGSTWVMLSAIVGLRACVNGGLFGQGDFAVSPDGTAIAVQSYTDGDGWNVYVSTDSGATFTDITFDYSAANNIFKNFKALIFTSNNILLVGNSNNVGTYNDIYRVTFPVVEVSHSDGSNSSESQIQVLAQKAAEAKHEAEVRTARVELTNQLTNPQALTAETFKQAAIAGVTKENFADVQAEISALPADQRSDISQVLKIARKYEVVGNLASEQVRNIPASSLIEIGLIPADFKYKTAILKTIQSLDPSQRDSFAEIKAAVDAETARIQVRKDRLSKVLARRSNR